jgi:hypothetical protein
VKIKALFVCLGLLGSGLVGACGKSSPTSPAEPAAVLANFNSAAASNVSGRVGTSSGFGVAYSTTSTTSGLIPGLTVTATGSGAATVGTSSVDSTGHFQLAVPPGPVELHFTAPGVDSKADLGAVAAGEKVDVLVNVAPSNPTADLEVTDRTNGGLRKIEGRVSAVPPATASGTFRIGDRLINTNSATEFYLNGRNATAGDLAVGSKARVTSMAGTDAITALEVNVVSDQAPSTGGGNNGGNNGSGGGNNGGGSGGGTGGGGTGGDGTGGGTGGGGGGGTGGGGTGGGGNSGGGNNGGGTGGSNEDTTVTGPIAGVLGACPGLNLTIGGTRVNTNANTQFELSCLSLLTASGNASATGTKNADGSITAKTVRR